MTIFYQHVGEAGWQRDAHSVGTPEQGLRRWSVHDIDRFLDHLNPFELMSIRSVVSEYAPNGFQIWGIPEGARGITADMKTGDFLMLLESSEFQYVGQVIHRVSQPCWDLSAHIWGEQRFPLIIFLEGELISYSWSDFRDAFGFASTYEGWKMRGQTMRLGPERIPASKWSTEEAFIASLMSTKGTNPFDLEKDFSVFANNLEVHFRRVKARMAQQEFRRQLLLAQGHQCAVCDISIAEVLDAAHIVPKEENGTDDHRNGLVLCALHHRMFDAGMFRIEPKTLVIELVNKRQSFEDLRMTRRDISHVSKHPHGDSLRWHWDYIGVQRDALNDHVADPPPATMS